MEKLVFIVTHAEEDAERATLPLVMAVTALASELEVTVVLQSNGVRLATKGYAKVVHEAPFPAVDGLIAQFQESGGRLLACQPCLVKRQIGPEQLIENVTIVNAPTIIKEVAEARNVIVY